MKKIMIALALLSVAGYGSAQNKSNRPAIEHVKRLNAMTPEERGSHEAERQAAELGLSAEQKESWRIAATERVAANKPLKEKMQGSTTPIERSKLRAEMHQNHLAFEKKVDSFLNEDQKKKFAEQKQARKESGRGHGKGHDRGHRHHEKGNK